MDNSELLENDVGCKSKEEIVRGEMCRYLQQVGILLRFPQATIAISMMLVHRFYSCNSHNEHDYEKVVRSSLFLSGKANETPRKIKDIIKAHCKHVEKGEGLDENDKMCRRMHDDIIIYERILLETLKFDMDTDQPYRHMVNMFSVYKCSKDIARTAWRFMNDSLFLPLCMTYSPVDIARACLYTSVKMLKDIDSESRDDVVEDLQDVTTKEISNKILGLYPSMTHLNDILRRRAKDSSGVNKSDSHTCV